MATFDVSNLTLNPAEVAEVNKIVFEKLYKKGRLTELFDIQTGIVNKSQILSVKRLAIGGGAANGCTPKEVGGFKFAEKFWDPALVTGRLSYCANDENRLFKVLAKWKNIYPDLFESIPDEVMQMVTALLLDHMERSIIAKAYFSDTAANTFTNGGNFTDGTDLTVFNQLDGIWKQIYGDATIPRFTVNKNAGADYASQKITADEAYAIVEGVFDNADERLKAETEAYIYATPDVFWGYQKKLATIEGAGGITNSIIGGRQAVTYLGKTVINMVDWSEVIKEYKNDGTKYFNPNLAIFTTKENMPLGTLSVEDLQNLRNAYDVGDNKVYTDYGYTLDAKVIESYMISVAY